MADEDGFKLTHNTPSPIERWGEDIIYATREGGERDERTGVNIPLVYQLFRQEHRWVAMYGRDKR